MYKKCNSLYSELFIEGHKHILCVFKAIGIVPPPRVFINGTLLNCSDAQFVELKVPGLYYNSTGRACDVQPSSASWYRAGALLITPSSLPALVEVSFTKGHFACQRFMVQCGEDTFLFVDK